MHTDEENPHSRKHRETDRWGKAHVTREAGSRCPGKWKGSDICPETDAN